MAKFKYVHLSKLELRAIAAAAALLVPIRKVPAGMKGLDMSDKDWDQAIRGEPIAADKVLTVALAV